MGNPINLNSPPEVVQVGFVIQIRILVTSEANLLIRGIWIQWIMSVKYACYVFTQDAVHSWLSPMQR